MKIYDNDSMYLSMRDYWFLVTDEIEFQRVFAIEYFERPIKAAWDHDNLLNIRYGEMFNVGMKMLKKYYYKRMYTREDLDGKDLVDPGIAIMIKLGWARNYPSYK